MCRDDVSRRAPVFAVLLAAMMCLPMVATAQEQPTPKADLFVGYQWLDPGATVPVPGRPVGRNKLHDIPQGVGTTLTYNFNSFLGLSLDYGGNFNKYGDEYTLSGGPRIMWRTEGANFFAHALVGMNRFTNNQLGDDTGFGGIAGGGIDLNTGWKRLSFRLIEADYVLGKHNYAKFAPPTQPDLVRPLFQGVRLRSGLIFNFGLPSGAPPAASCSVQPSEVMVGEPITATATTSNFNPKHTLTYSWSSTGGKVTGKDNTAMIDTNGIAAGNYTVTANISDPKMKKNGEASCTANFTVKELPKHPPTMSCSANPTTVQTGGTSTISCTCTSPDNASVNVSEWTASSGTVNGTGENATLNTTGASPGSVTVSATCTDSRGLNTSASTSVNVEAPPPPPPPPQASKLSSCDFPNKVKPWRVDNTCKAILDDVAARLQHEPDSKLVIVGNSAPEEKRKNLAAERAVDAKAYLSGGEAKQGIDASRIETRTGNGGTRTADFWIVPAGGTFSEPDTTTVDESMVKPIPDHPVARKRMAKPKAH